MRSQAGTLLWRAGIAAALVCAIGVLPWLSHTDPALTVLRARSAERDPTPEVLTAVLALLGALAVTAAAGVRRRHRTTEPVPPTSEKPSRTRELVTVR